MSVVAAVRRSAPAVRISLASVATAVAIAAAVALNHAVLPLLIVGVVIFLPLEQIAPRRHLAMPRATTFINLAHATVTASLTTLLLGLAVGLIAFLPVVTPVAAWFDTAPAWLALTVAVVIGDTGYYWTHRALHTVPVLWRFHRIHHSSEELHWLAAARAHPVDQLLLHMGWLLPLHLLGARAVWFGVYATLLTMQTLLVHSNVDIVARRLSRVVVTPEFHHWHHSAERDAWNRNYASQLSFLDTLFGTAWLPAKRRVARYGVGEKVPDSYAGQLLMPFAEAAAVARPSGNVPPLSARRS